MPLMGDSQVAHTRNCPVPLLHWAEAEYVLLLTEQLDGVADAGAAPATATMPPATRPAALIATRTRLLAIYEYSILLEGNHFAVES
ncbi:MAG: hypothetical protein ABIQ09_14410 [Jatrophihabitantaceae bacterium]